MSFSYPMTSGDGVDLTNMLDYLQSEINDLTSKYNGVARSVSRNPGNQLLNTRLSNLETVIQGVTTMTKNLTENTNSRPTLADLKRSESSLQELIKKNSDAIQGCEVRLSKVLLPEETRYYLETGEIDEFKATFAKLKAMMAKFETLYKNMVAYTVNN